MSSPKNDQEKLEKAVRRVISSYIEKFLFPVVFALGIYFLYLSKDTESFWPSLYLNVGSNLVVFVFLFWAFQYFTGKQPGGHEQENYEQFRNIIDQPHSPSDYADIVSNKPARRSMRSVNGETTFNEATLPNSNNEE